MSAVEDWREFANSLGRDRATTEGGSSWSLIFARRDRTIALPAAELPEPASLRFFVRTARKWWWAWFLLSCHRFACRLLPQAQLSASQHGELQRILSRPEEVPGPLSSDILAIQFGSSGPLQKVTVLASASDGSQLVAKLALRESADDRIDIEAGCLGRLAVLPGLAVHVPAVVGTGKTWTGRRYFVMRAVSGKASRETFEKSHAELLRGISGVDCRVVAWQESALVQDIETRLTTLAKSGADGLKVLSAGWFAACRALAGERLPLCLNHGDFASWNLLRTTQGLVALDWEYARPHWNPMGDFFHFHLIAAALDGRLRKGHVRRDLLLSKASDHAADVFALDRAFTSSIAAPLLLVYMVDTVSFYAVVSGGIERQHPVVDSYLQWITELT